VRHLLTTRKGPPRLPAALSAALLVLLLLATAASAGTTNKIFEECSNGVVPRGFSQQAYNRALKHMRAELSEYSDCPDLIRKAELANAGGTSGVSGAGGASSPAAVAPATPAEQHGLEEIPHAAAPAIKVGGEVIHPGVVHVDIASALSALPTPLLALLAFLLACALAALGLGLRSYLRARRHGA
jgi:hypothetical protein